MEINFDLKITREKKSRFDWIDFEKICSKLIISLFHDAKRNIFENCLGNNAYKISMQTNNRAITTSSIASSNIQMQRFSMKRFGEIKLSSVRLYRGHFLAIFEHARKALFDWISCNSFRIVFSFHCFRTFGYIWIFQWNKLKQFYDNKYRGRILISTNYFSSMYTFRFVKRII